MTLAYEIQTRFLKAIESKNLWSTNELKDLYIKIVNQILIEGLDSAKR